MADYIDNSIGNDDGNGYLQYSGSEDQNVPLIKDKQRTKTRNTIKLHPIAVYIIETSHSPCKYNRGNNNDFADAQTVISQTVNGSNGLLTRSDSICSYRSPSHSRTNSFSKKITSHDGRKGSVPSASPSAILHMKLTDTLSHRNSFDGISERSLNQHRHRHSQDDARNDCEIEDEQNASEFSKKNINIQAAVIHVLGDFIQSIGVFVASLLIKFYPNFKIADPICTFVFSIIVILTTVRIMKESLSVLLDAVPSSVRLSDLREELSRIDGVSVHFLNVWSITTNHHVMSAHVLIDTHANSEDILYLATRVARKKFGIKNATLQIERQTNTDNMNNILEPVGNFV
ncbi:Zinc transporter 8, partial [Pseudolycoriella hygida]